MDDSGSNYSDDVGSTKYSDDVASNSSQVDNVDVQKLKDLVKRLEKQNEHLRSRTGKLGGSTSKNSRNAKSFQQIDNSSYHSSDEIETVDLSGFDSEGEDATSWLYQSPLRSREATKTTRASLRKWMREELDNPSTPEYLAAKRNIISKLERTLPDFNYNYDEGLSYDNGEFPEEDMYHQEHVNNNHHSHNNNDDYHSRPHYQHLNSRVDITPVNNPTVHTGTFTRSSNRKLKSQSSIDKEIYTPKSHYSSCDELDRADVIQGSNLTSSLRSPSPSIAPLSIHNLPIPSQTMTSAHGLVASSNDFSSERSTLGRSLVTPPSKNSRSESPASARTSSRKGTPTLNRNTTSGKSTPEVATSSTPTSGNHKSKLSNNSSGKPPLRHKPLMMKSRSSIASPTSSNMTATSSPSPSRMSRQPGRKKSNLAPSSGSENLTFQRSSTFTLATHDDDEGSSPTPQLKQRPQTSLMTSPATGRRSLPRPQISSNPNPPSTHQSSKLKYNGGGSRTSSPMATNSSLPSRGIPRKSMTTRRSNDVTKGGTFTRMKRPTTTTSSLHQQQQKSDIWADDEVF